jgi:hypothetical protein
VSPDGQSLRRTLHHLAQVELHLLEFQLARVDLRKVEDVVDDREQPFGGILGHLHVLALDVGELGIEDELGHPHDGGERGADLVAHVREELAFCPVRLLGDPLRAPELRVGADSPGARCI